MSQQVRGGPRAPFGGLDHCSSPLLGAYLPQEEA
jgi:hypothetical protein